MHTIHKAISPKCCQVNENGCEPKSKYYGASVSPNYDVNVQKEIAIIEHSIYLKTWICRNALF